MDLYQGNLKNATGVPLKIVTKQLLQVLEYLDSKIQYIEILKQQYILYQSGNIYLGDLGSSNQLDVSKSLSQVCSRAYRAPELLFDQIFYYTKIDLWAVSCIQQNQNQIKSYPFDKIQ